MEVSIERKVEIEREFAKALCDEEVKKNIVLQFVDKPLVFIRGFLVI